MDTNGIIIIASGKGGAGKSTLTVNCGVGLARLGKKTLLVDADAGLRTLDLMLGVEDRVVYDAADVLNGGCEPVKAIVATEFNGLHLLPAPQETFDRNLLEKGFRQLCRGLSHYYDYILIDAPAGVGSGLTGIAKAASRAVLVSLPDPVSVRDGERAASVLRVCGIDHIRLVINRAHPAALGGTIPDLDAVIDGIGVRLIGVVPEDKQVCMARGRPLPVSNRGAAAAFSGIAERIDGRDVPLQKL